jgi:hypothetical protein
MFNSKLDKSSCFIIFLEKIFFNSNSSSLSTLELSVNLKVNPAFSVFVISIHLLALALDIAILISL